MRALGKVLNKCIRFFSIYIYIFKFISFIFSNIYLDNDSSMQFYLNRDDKSVNFKR